MLQGERGYIASLPLFCTIHHEQTLNNQGIDADMLMIFPLFLIVTGRMKRAE
jgi:hypothetical protein